MPFPERIGPSELNNGALTTKFTANRDVRLTQLILTNTNPTAQQVTIHIVPDGSTAVDSNRIIVVDIIETDLSIYNVDIPMKIRDTLQAMANATGVNLTGAFTDEKPR